MAARQRMPGTVDRLVLDLDDPAGRPLPAAPVSPRRRGMAWALVALAAAALVFGVTFGGHPAEHRAKRLPPQRLAVIGDAAHPGPTVALDGYRFRLPSGLAVKETGRQRSDPGSRVDYVNALGRRSGIDVTVMHGPVVAKRTSAPAPAPMRVTVTHIGGHPATVDRFGVGASGPSQMEVRVRVAPNTLLWVESENLSSDDVVAMLTRALRR